MAFIKKSFIIVISILGFVIFTSCSQNYSDLLSSAAELADKGKFIESLDKLETARSLAVTDEENAKIDSEYSRVLNEFSHSNNEQTYDQIRKDFHDYCIDPSKVTIDFPIYGTDTEIKNFYSARKDLEHQFVTPSEVRYVVCVADESRELIETCEYWGNYTHFRYQYVDTIQIFDVRDIGNESKVDLPVEIKVRGRLPSDCAQQISVPSGRTRGETVGPEPTAQQILKQIETKILQLK